MADDGKDMGRLLDASQWDVVKRLPLNLLFYVAYADGGMDEEEATVLATIIERGSQEGLFRDKFVRYLFGVVKDDLDGILQTTKEGDLAGELALARDILMTKFDDDKYQNIMNSMRLALMAVAAASGGMREFSEENVSAAERVRMSELADILEIDTSWRIRDIEY